MVNVTVDDIQRDPLKYLRQVEAGETFLIFQSNKLIAEMKPVSSSSKSRRCDHLAYVLMSSPCLTILTSLCRKRS